MRPLPKPELPPQPAKPRVRVAPSWTTWEPALADYSDLTAPLEPADVVGPICESGDYLAKGRLLPPIAAGDLIAVMTAGAYGAVQAGTYNSRPLVPEILVKGGRFAIVRPRQTYEDLIGLDRLAAWQS